MLMVATFALLLAGLCPAADLLGAGSVRGASPALAGQCGNGGGITACIARCTGLMRILYRERIGLRVGAESWCRLDVVLQKAAECLFVEVRCHRFAGGNLPFLSRQKHSPFAGMIKPCRSPAWLLDEINRRKVQSKHWRGLQAENGWKAAPNGDLRMVMPLPPSPRQTRNTHANLLLT